MDWTPIVQGLITGFAATAPLGVLGVTAAWILRRAFNLGRWQATLATKEDLQALRVDVAELKSTVDREVGHGSGERPPLKSSASA